MTDQTITSVSRESRIFKPSAEFKNQANLGSFANYRRLYSESVNAPDKFWERQAKKFLSWRKPFNNVLKWKAPHAKWFSGGQLNVAENCVDRHLVRRHPRSRPVHGDRRRLPHLGPGWQPVPDRRPGRCFHRARRRHRPAAWRRGAAAGHAAFRLQVGIAAETGILLRWQQTLNQLI